MLHVAKLHGHDARGCDVSSQFASYAKEHYDVDIDIGRFERMGYPDESFDVILLFNVIENVPNQAEFLAAVRRTLKPGGHFVVNFVDMHRNAIAALQKDKYFLFRPPICYAFTQAVLSRLLEGAGFRVTSTHRDYRYMHLEKMLTLLRWRTPHRAAKALRVERINFPVYAYPSHLLVAEKV
jgi:ubiquinone/menaquinone biosynthesis C-methylase UbiE